MNPDEYVGGKKALVMGLGFVSAGATIKWLCDHGASVTVTDLWPRGKPDKAIEVLGEYKDRIEIVIGAYRGSDFESCDILVVNPSISSEDPYVQKVRERGIPVENELSLFMRFCPSKVVAVTGTRGKTTTATWTHHFISADFPSAVLAGNMGDTPLLSILDGLTKESPVVAEVSSFQLELLPSAGKSPQVAVITNIMRDHLNRYGTMEKYVDAKAHIFELQEADDVLILKKSDEWTDYFIEKKPKSRMIFYDEIPLGFIVPDDFENMWGRHNVDNLKTAAHAAHSAGVSWGTIEQSLSKLSSPPFRQEIIFNEERLSIVNDTTATTPDGTIAALNRFSKKGEIILIAGGTDKELSFDKWASVVENTVASENLVLLEGSATAKMLDTLPESYRIHVKVLNTLEECVEKALLLANKIESNTVVLFSPGAASFEKFQNEFDRGRKFSDLIREKFN